jgi:hypothetical protein
MGSLNFPSLDAAIASFENVNPLYNNPGGIQSGPYAAKYGGTPVGSGVASFPTAAAGQAAQDALITSKVNANPNLTLSDLINSWAPGNAPGNTPAGTQSYLDYVANQTGLPATGPVASLGPGGTAPFIPGTNVPYPAPGTPVLSSAPTAGTAGAWLNNLFGITPSSNVTSTTGFTASRIAAGILGFLFIFAGLAALAFTGVGKAADVVLGGHERVKRVARAAAMVS